MDNEDHAGDPEQRLFDVRSFGAFRFDRDGRTVREMRSGRIECGLVAPDAVDARQLEAIGPQRGRHGPPANRAISSSFTSGARSSKYAEYPETRTSNPG